MELQQDLNKGNNTFGYYFSTKNKWVFLISILVVTISVISFLLLKRDSLMGNKKNESSKITDFSKNAISNNDDLRKSLELIAQGDYSQAIPILSEAKEKEPDLTIKSVIDLTLADAYFSQKQPLLAANNLIRISQTQEYPSSTRAFALTSILQQYNGTKNKELLTVFGTITATSSADIIEKAHREIVLLHPMGISVAYLASVDMKRNKAGSAKIFLEAIQRIDNDIAYQDKGQGSNYIVPNIMLAKANLMKQGEKLGYATSSEIIKVYQETIQVAKNKQQIITSQFAILHYINYLGNTTKNNPSAVTKELLSSALELLKKEQITEMVQSNLTSTNAKNSFSGIFLLTKKEKDYQVFFSQFGWI